ncbi:NlpC/P60 family protein [Actinoallomurus sp. CA-142502]|uniref:C40 family peptidase n=1 Tax=Actinoallomurus sp. CA-142502 TaxID=3239885 RepID=UPI003D8B3B85
MAGSTRRRRRRRRRLGALSLTTLAVSALLTDPSAAIPSPGARDLARSRRQVHDRAADVGRINAELARANAELDDMNDQAELAVERFNGARARLDQAGRDYQAALARTARARDRLDQSRRDLAVFASKAYRTDDSIPSAAAVLGGRGGPQGFLERASFMQFLANRQHFAVEQEQATHTIADLFEKQSRRALGAQRDATRATAAARQVATAAVTRQRSSVQRIQRQKEGLVAALKRAQARTAELQRAHVAKAAGKSAAQAVPRNAREAARAVRGASLGAVAARAALRWIGTPYSWGGGNASGPTIGIAQGAHTVGFDCSGLVTYAWARAGVPLTHYATSQYNAGPHPTRDQLRPGDLVFFAHNPADPSTIHHVGIYIGGGQMVEAPFTGARVRISNAFRPDYAGATRPAGPR